MKGVDEWRLQQRMHLRKCRRVRLRFAWGDGIGRVTREMKAVAARSVTDALPRLHAGLVFLGAAVKEMKQTIPPKYFPFGTPAVIPRALLARRQRGIVFPERPRPFRLGGGGHGDRAVIGRSGINRGGNILQAYRSCIELEARFKINSNK